jgi:hypothetical protein
MVGINLRTFSDLRVDPFMNKEPLCQETDEKEVALTKKEVPFIPEDLRLSHNEKVLMDNEVSTPAFILRF